LVRWKSDRAWFTRGRVIWPAGGRLTTAFFAILCDILSEKSIDFVAIDRKRRDGRADFKSVARVDGLASYDPRNAVSCATDL